MDIELVRQWIDDSEQWCQEQSSVLFGYKCACGEFHTDVRKGTPCYKTATPAWKCKGCGSIHPTKPKALTCCDTELAKWFV